MLPSFGHNVVNIGTTFWSNNVPKIIDVVVPNVPLICWIPSVLLDTVSLLALMNIAVYIKGSYSHLKLTNILMKSIAYLAHQNVSMLPIKPQFSLFHRVESNYKC